MAEETEVSQPPALEERRPSDKSHHADTEAEAHAEVHPATDIVLSLLFLSFALSSLRLHTHSEIIRLTG